MTAVLIIGFEPELVDFSKLPGMTAEKVRAGLSADAAALATQGFDAEILYVDLGEHAGEQTSAKLQAKRFDVICIGAGIRAQLPATEAFEKILNAAHAAAPQAKFCFNTSPADSKAAILRWAKP